MLEVKIPELGESIVEAELAKWHREDGDEVEKDDLLCELATDKITLELFAEQDGRLHILVPEGEMVPIGAVVATIGPAEGVAATPPASPREQVANSVDSVDSVDSVAGGPAPTAVPAAAAAPQCTLQEVGNRTTRQPLSPLRRTIAARLVAARQQSAPLTTFGEADLSRVQELRRRHRDGFQQRHGVRLGLTSFFVKAAVEALKEYPLVNARIEEQDIVLQHFYDIGIAIGSGQGLVVPVLRDADGMSFAAIEKAIDDFSARAESGRLQLAELQGGTFTISNGGVYGSLLSTPLINPPQCAVLGLHAIQPRPVVRDEAIVVRPMMYLALSYDHRLIDGREAVGFLARIRELIEDPDELLLEAG
jgi:2-oxoglutarate dehydrogenase E2 component (dihydrolipoamide succinyltransferase)